MLLKRLFFCATCTPGGVTVLVVVSLPFLFFFILVVIVVVEFYLKKGAILSGAGAARCDRNWSPLII